MKKQSFFILVGSLLMLVVAAIGFAFQPSQKAAPGTVSQTKVSTAGIDGLGGSWTLTNHDGNAVTDKDYTGKYRLMFFGFTYCPDVCPTELKRLTMVLQGLGQDANNVTPLFVTIDPERDTPQALKEYLGRYDPRFIGLTGSVKQIEHMETIYKVYSAKVDDPELTEYTVNHSALVYLIGPDDKVLHLFHSSETPDQMIDIIRQAMKRS